jgi:hypothetical protein
MNEISPIYQLEAIIKDVEKTVRNFSISGPGVSGHIKDGYLVNARPGAGQSGEGAGGGGPPPPPPTCPGSFNFAVAGLTIGCGCEDIGGGGSIQYSDTSINGTFSVSEYSFVGDDCVYFGSGGAVHYDQFSTPACALFDSSGDPGTLWFIGRVSGIWYAYGFPSGPSTNVFYGSTSDPSIPITNVLSCTGWVTPIIICDDFSEFFGGPGFCWNLFSEGSSGTVTLTLP